MKNKNTKITKREVEILKKKIETLMKASFPWSDSFKKYDLYEPTQEALLGLIDWANCGIENPEDKNLLEAAKTEFLQKFVILMQSIERIVMESLWQAALQNSLGSIIRKITTELDIRNLYSDNKNDEEFFA
jgi:hypothetical protein